MRPWPCIALSFLMLSAACGDDGGGGEGTGGTTNAPGGGGVGGGGAGGFGECIGVADDEPPPPPAQTGYIYFATDDALFITREGEAPVESLPSQDNGRAVLIPSPTRAQVVYQEGSDARIVDAVTNAEVANWPDMVAIAWLDEDTLVVRPTAADSPELFLKDLDGTEGMRFPGDCDAREAGLSPDRTRLAVACRGDSASSGTRVLDLTDGSVIVHDGDGDLPLWTDNGFIVWVDDLGPGGRRVYHAEWDDPATLSQTDEPPFDAENLGVVEPWGSGRVVVEVVYPERRWYSIDIPCGVPAAEDWLPTFGTGVQPEEFAVSVDQTQILHVFESDVYRSDFNGEDKILIAEVPTFGGAHSVAW